MRTKPKCMKQLFRTCKNNVFKLLMQQKRYANLVARNSLFFWGSSCLLLCKNLDSSSAVSSTSSYFIRYSKPCILHNQQCKYIQVLSTFMVIKSLNKQVQLSQCILSTENTLNKVLRKCFKFSLLSKLHQCNNINAACRHANLKVYIYATEKKRHGSYQGDICIKCKRGLIQLHIKFLE